MSFKGLGLMAACALLLAGCVNADFSASHRVDVDDESMDGGISSADVRTVASRMGPAILGLPEVADGQIPVRIKMADVKNTSRFFIDRDLFAKRLRVELNRYGAGRVRFLDRNERNQAARAQVLRDREVEEVRKRIRDLGREIGAHPLFQNAAKPAKVAVIPVLNANLVNMNADSFTAMLRGEIVSAAGGKLQFLMPGHTQGADYYLTGQFYPESLKKEGIINLAEYIDVIDRRVKSGKSLYLGFDSVHSPSNGTDVVMTSPQETILAEMVRDPAYRANPNVDKRLNVMIVKPSDMVSVYEKTVSLDRRFGDNSGKADFVLSCEISGMSQSANGATSDYLLVSVSLVEPESNEVVWEDAYEVKRMSRVGIVYR